MLQLSSNVNGDFAAPAHSSVLLLVWLSDLHISKVGTSFDQLLMKSWAAHCRHSRILWNKQICIDYSSLHLSFRFWLMVIPRFAIHGFRIVHDYTFNNIKKKERSRGGSGGLRNGGVLIQRWAWSGWMGECVCVWCNDDLISQVPWPALSIGKTLIPEQPHPHWSSPWLAKPT